MTTFISKTQAARLAMHEWIATEKDENLVIEVANFMRKKYLEAKFSKPVTNEEYVNRILEGLAQAEKGEGTDVEELEKLVETW